MAGPVLVASFVGVFATFLTHQWWSNGKEKEDSQSLLGLIQRRRSIFPKQYSSKPVPRKILDEMLEAARYGDPNSNLSLEGINLFVSGSNHLIFYLLVLLFNK